MDKPFHTITEELLSPSALRRLELYVLRHPALVEEHQSTTFGGYDGISSASLALKCVFPELQALAARLMIQHEFGIVYVKPNTTVLRHRDGRLPARHTAIIQAVHPALEYAPTHFWESVESTTPAHVLTKEQTPAIVNLQELHSLVNGDTPRFNFQVSFPIPYEVLLQRYAEGKLFKVQSRLGTPRTGA